MIMESTTTWKWFVFPHVKSIVIKSEKMSTWPSMCWCLSNQQGAPLEIVTKLEEVWWWQDDVDQITFPLAVGQEDEWRNAPPTYFFRMVCRSDVMTETEWQTGVATVVTERWSSGEYWTGAPNDHTWQTIISGMILTQVYLKWFCGSSSWF